MSDFTDANSDNNKFKNRVTNAIPCKWSGCDVGVKQILTLSFLMCTDNHNRVTLMMKPGIGGSDYINASYVDVSV